jgi:RalA-binding protein 1
MRTERDTYKARLQAAGLSVELAKKDKPRSLRPSASNTTMSIVSENGSLDPRAPMIRHLSDTSGLYTPFSPVPYNRSFVENTASGSRNDDRPATPPQSQDANGRDLRAHHPNGSSNMSLPPAIVPPRSVALQQGSSSAPSNPPRSNEAEKGYTRVPTSVANNSGSPMPQGRSSQQSSIPLDLHIDANGVLGSHAQTPLIQHTPNTVVSPPLYSASVTPAPGHLTSLTPHSSSSLSSSLLSPIPENSKPVNRDSSVSLPDEAKRYFANMGESPLQSPGLTGAATKFAQIQAQTGQGANTGENSPSKLGRAGALGGDESEFLDMEEEEGEEEEEEEEEEYRVEETEQQQQPSSAINRNDKLADTDDFPMPPSYGPTQVHQPSHTQSGPSQSMPNPGSQFPPAPEVVVASQTRWHSQSDSSMLSQSQSSQESTPLTPQPDSPFPESYLSSTKSTHGASSNGPNPTFRALPLIAGDLKTTRIIVSHSSIRPNDRGKDVLSFEIEVDPGKGKEPWKVEKLYSDVLGLDHRLRAVVGKGVSRKIAALPEGKLWKDHAPAKSDQRKVRKTQRSRLFFWR